MAVEHCNNAPGQQVAGFQENIPAKSVSGRAFIARPIRPASRSSGRLSRPMAEIAIMRQMEKTKMAQFAILTGKALASRIAGFGKVAATFSESTHQLAYSALNHVELHHDAVYCNALFNATPVNYRGALVTWFKAFGKVAYDNTTKEFTYSKAAKSDMATALTVSPADYQKQSSTKDAADFDEIKTLESFIKKMVDKGASKRMIHSLNGVMRMVKGDMPEDKTNVVAAPEVVKARKAKAAAKTPRKTVVEQTPEVAAA